MIEVENLSKRYGDLTAIKDLSFQVQAGEFFQNDPFILPELVGQVIDEASGGDAPARHLVAPACRVLLGSTGLELGNDRSELRRRLAECLGRLPAVWRTVLTLRDSEEHSYEQIAAMLRIAPL